jgi:ubiquinone/menaquinone biosynthesis C-methylase UbiE
MHTAFDQITSSYDETFTYSEVGKRLRNIVWNYLEKTLPLNKQLDILELNCGTGEDALFLAKRGNTVTASDMSETMLNIVNEKVLIDGLVNQVHTRKINIEELRKSTFDKKFDLIFSNFGGLNCVDERVHGRLSNEFKLLLNTNGKIILVLMPRFCFWESFYFLTKLKLNETLRRMRTGYTMAKVGGADVKTFYYSPSNIAKKFSNNFIVKKIIPIGFFIPPTYLDSFFTKKKKTLNILTGLETKSSKVPFLSNAADHFLIDMELKD